MQTPAATAILQRRPAGHHGGVQIATQIDVKEASMIGYVTIGTNDLPRAAAF